MLKELAKAEDAANRGIHRSSSTSHAITRLRTPQSTADDSSESTAQLRVARSEAILRAESVALCRKMGVYRQVEDRILLLDSDNSGQVLQINEWIDVDLEMDLDSGASEHVMDLEDAPGYVASESTASRRGQGFVVGSGARVPNAGQV